MNLWESIIVAVEGIKNNKLRSFLTTLGIVIGIAAVIAVVAIGQGGRAMLIKEMESFGTNMFFVFANYEEGKNTKPGDFRKSDIDTIKRLVPEVDKLAPVRYSNGELRGSQGKKNAQIIGTTSEYSTIRNLVISRGRFLTGTDQNAGRGVAVLDEELAAELFGHEDPLGKRVTINNYPAVVTGIVKKENSALSFDSRLYAYVPLSFLQSSTNWNIIHQLVGSASSKDEVYRAMDRTRQILERRHNTTGHYATHSLEQEMESANKITGIMMLVISSIACISLLVGGIGVMNIMLVSVTERTREIGIRMASGARRKDILMQFLVESTVLCLLGGIIGMTLGGGGALLIAVLADWPPLISWYTAVIAFLFSAVIGIFFGLYPANKASKLDPIEALRRE